MVVEPKEEIINKKTTEFVPKFYFPTSSSSDANLLDTTMVSKFLFSNVIHPLIRKKSMKSSSPLKMKIFQSFNLNLSQSKFLVFLNF